MTIRSLRNTAGALLFTLGVVNAAQAQTECPAEANSGYRPTKFTRPFRDDGTWCKRSDTYWKTYPATEKTHCSETPQSPINLKPSNERNDQAISLFYRVSPAPVDSVVSVNNGHTVELLLNPEDYAAEGKAKKTPAPPDGVPAAPPERAIEFGGKRYVLDNLHFHHPSEHLLNGERFPMELHIVHKAGTSAAVIAIFIRNEGGKNDILDAVFNAMEKTKSKNDKQRVSFDGVALMKLLPPLSYMRYEGSLTTPGCDTGVTWLVLNQSITASNEQIAKFKEAIRAPLGFPTTENYPTNARPLQVDQPVKKSTVVKIIKNQSGY